MKRFFRTVLNDLFALVELMLFVYIWLKLFSANSAAPLVSFWYSVADVLLAPVRYIFPTPHIIGGSTFDLVAVAAMVFYAIFFFVLLRVIRLLSGEHHPTYE